MIIFYDAARLFKQAGDSGIFAFQEHTKKRMEAWEIEGRWPAVVSGTELLGPVLWWSPGPRQGQSQTLLSAPLTSLCCAVL